MPAHHLEMSLCMFIVAMQVLETISTQFKDTPFLMQNGLLLIYTIHPRSGKREAKFVVYRRMTAISLYSENGFIIMQASNYLTEQVSHS